MCLLNETLFIFFKCTKHFPETINTYFRKLTMTATFAALDYFLFVAVLFISALIGIYYLLKEKWAPKDATADDLLMGGREMHLFPVAMSLVASYMSAITVLGVPTEMYVFGTQYWLVAFSGLLTFPVTCQIFLPFFHNLQLSSAYQVRIK